MDKRRSLTHVAMLVLCALFLYSCSGGEKEEATESAQPQEEPEQIISYLNQDVSFGVFFDEKGTRRTLDLDRDQKEFDVYIIINFPEDIEIAAAEWRLELPEGISVINDKYILNRTISMGLMDYGLSERFPCVSGPSCLLHTLTLRTDRELKNAEIAVLPSTEGEFLGVAECTEGYPQIRATSFRGVVNPGE
ncbi:MAG TPA: hypothetical protein VMX58_07965 [Patescibacteria group bacterium]|nr:hypothetical protein [Patescibacteria group bacterium]